MIALRMQDIIIFLILYSNVFVVDEVTDAYQICQARTPQNIITKMQIALYIYLIEDDFRNKINKTKIVWDR
jgi:hypothetical protein